MGYILFGVVLSSVVPGYVVSASEVMGKVKCIELSGGARRKLGGRQLDLNAQFMQDISGTWQLTYCLKYP